MYHESFFTALPLLGFGAWWLVLLFSSPLALYKQVVHVLQLVESSQIIASFDINERAMHNKQN